MVVVGTTDSPQMALYWVSGSPASFTVWAIVVEKASPNNLKQHHDIKELFSSQELTNLFSGMKLLEINVLWEMEKPQPEGCSGRKQLSVHNPV